MHIFFWSYPIFTCPFLFIIVQLVARASLFCFMYLNDFLACNNLLSFVVVFCHISHVSIIISLIPHMIILATRSSKVVCTVLFNATHCIVSIISGISIGYCGSKILSKGLVSNSTLVVGKVSSHTVCKLPNFTG